MWWQADGSPKGSRKMANRKAQLSRDFLQRKFPAEISFKLLAGPLHLPWSKAAAQRFGGTGANSRSHGGHSICELFAPSCAMASAPSLRIASRICELTSPRRFRRNDPATIFLFE